MVTHSKRITVLQVLMNGLLVGRLRNSARGVLSFGYDQSWLDFAGRIPISQSMPLSNREYSGMIVENYFDNLLPDNQSIRNRLQARVGAEFGRCFDLLTRIGRDCIGALQLLPENESVEIRAVQAHPLTEEEISVVLKNYHPMLLGIDLDADFRISLAGAQKKTPLYDVISVYPLVATRQIDRHRVAMAILVYGKNSHYRWNLISRRHWLDTARKCRFSPEKMDHIIDECCDRLNWVIEQVGMVLPPGFPEEMAASIFSGMQRVRDRLGK